MFSRRPLFPSLYYKNTTVCFPSAFNSDKYKWDTMIDLCFRIVLPKGPCNSSKHRKPRLKNGKFFSHTGEVEASHKRTLFKTLHAQISYALPSPFWKRQIESNLSQTFNIYFCHIKGENSLQQLREKICIRN